jgi:Asp/Glu/hydantoin racemase
VPILKIDDPLYARVASAPGRVGLICTTPSTVAPSRALLAAHAQSAGREIPAESVLCGAAFEALASGQRDLHDRLVCEAAAELAPRVDRIVLAQASLAHLAEPLADQLGLPVFTSPELLVQEVGEAQIAELLRVFDATWWPDADVCTTAGSAVATRTTAVCLVQDPH